MDEHLQLELVAKGLKLPTSMDFLAADDILVLEKDNGTVRRILNGSLLSKPVLDLNVANKYDRGILGIAISEDPSENDHENKNIFIYMTESKIDGSDYCTSWKSCEGSGEPEGNRLYRYKWNGSSLVEPKLILDLPARPGPAHNGGTVLVGPDKNVYLVVGDLRAPNSLAQNIQDGLPASGSSGILRITQDGRPVGNGILGNEHPLNLYYAYGIRNSFGIDFDPLSGTLWDTENGYLFGDEINLVEPGFNSGWARTQGLWNISYLDDDGKDASYRGHISLKPDRLVEFNGKGNYSIPELYWNGSVGLTALRFLNSEKLGTNYQNDMFVGDYLGRIYHFELNKERTEIDHRTIAADRMVGSNSKDNIFAEGFESVTDIKLGPDGYLYIISFYDGSIYRISRNSSSSQFGPQIRLN